MANQPTPDNHSLDDSGFKEFPKTTALIWIVVLVVYGFFIVALNIATFLTFLLNRHLRIRSLYCLINQAFADASFTACSGSFTFNYACVKIFDFVLDKQTLQVTLKFAAFTLLASLVSLDIVALERVYATFLPFRHRTTKPKTYLLVFASIWCLALLVSLLRVYTHYPVPNYILVFHWTILSMSPFIILISYIAIFIKVKTRNGLQLQNQQQSSSFLFSAIPKRPYVN
jgi:hypothetical protein